MDLCSMDTVMLMSCILLVHDKYREWKLFMSYTIFNGDILMSSKPVYHRLLCIHTGLLRSKYDHWWCHCDTERTVWLVGGVSTVLGITCTLYKCLKISQKLFNQITSFLPWAFPLTPWRKIRFCEIKCFRVRVEVWGSKFWPNGNRWEKKLKSLKFQSPISRKGA